MKWKKLLSPRRRERDGVSRAERDLRSEFEKDYHRIIVSASFRRLQDKTQVFPLDKSDFIRTRLTHSLEVSSVGRSLAQNIGTSIAEKRLDPEFTAENARDICDILQCAGLIHDIGNPPFGHFGEEVIREWFVKNLPVLTAEGRPVRSALTDEEYEDLVRFEGNAQGLRMVTRLDYPVHSDGMNLTAGLLSAVIKYPASSLECGSGGIYQKNGYFESEKEIYREIAAETGTEGARNPLAFVLEAADDIAYSTADIEDAFKKGFYDYETFLRELRERGTARVCTSRLSDLYDMARLSGTFNPEEYAIRAWLREMQDVLIVSATDGFISHYRAIMSGSWHGELISSRQGAVLLQNLKQIAYDYAFTSASIYRSEIAAHTMLTALTGSLVKAALMYDRGMYPGLLEEKYLSLIPENYKQVYLKEAASAPEDRKTYLRILLATDTISGMTDSYAKDLYSELTGIT